MDRVAIIDYGSGNLHSAAKAFERAARESGADARIAVTATAKDVAARRPHRAARRRRLCRLQARARRRARHARSAGERSAREGPAVPRHLRRRAAHGRRAGWSTRSSRGSAGSAARCARSSRTTRSLKIPHMGWNTLRVLRDHPLLDGIETGAEGLHAYFVHSYQLVAADAGNPGRRHRVRRAGDGAWSLATTWPARNFIPRRARRWGSG